jgi:DNA helicase-2/ATP-dependent DNA helicase PcrA
MWFLDDLNPAQLAAVTHPGGPLLILAGAGSGKTRVLTRRVAYLLARGEDPQAILAITFTNKAADEMKARVRELVGKVADGMWVSTFHAACVRLLRRELDRVGRRGDFTIIDTTDQRAALRECLKRLDLPERQWSPARIAGAISKAKNQLLGPSEYRAEASDFYHRTVGEVYGLYQQYLRDSNGLDFDDLLMETVRLLRGHPDVLAYYQRRFAHVLVDEYQDTNRAQYLIVRLLTERHRNAFVVGDDDQSIYRFRGADIANILDFEKDYPDAKVVKLEQNYRSTQPILDAAYHIIARNVHRKPKRLWTERPSGGRPVVCTVPTGECEAEFVAKEIIRRVQAGVSPAECAVLYRTHAQSRLLEEAFERWRVPYTVVGGVRFYERKEIKDLLAYLRLLVNAHDYISLRRVANVPRRGLGPVSVTRLEEHARQQGMSITAALSAADTVSGLTRPQVQAACELAGELERLSAAVQAAGALGISEAALEAFGLRAEIERTAKDAREADERLDNLREFLAAAQSYDLREPGGGLRGFLEEMALLTDIDTLAEADERVPVMTLHSAKGLEFDSVFLVGMEEGLLPHVRSLEDEGELEEERRLCYVGITRARNHLYLVTAERRQLYGDSQPAIRSRFLHDLPPVLVEETTYPPPPAAEPVTGRTGVVRPADNGLRPGQKVRHPQWGGGTVVAVRGDGDEAVVSVAFPDRGIKQLMALYAGLVKDGSE